MRLKKTFVYILFLIIFYSTNADAIRKFKFPDEKLPPNFCENLLNEFKFSSFPYGEDQEPFITNIDLLIEDIHHINGKDLDFDASFSLWIDWKDPRLTELFKEKNLYTGKGKPYWLCDYEPDALWGSQKRILDPGIEFFNRKDKPDFQSGMVDWVDLFSDGTIETRLRDSAKFKSNTFDFRRFPFDTQVLSFELWSEFPSTMFSLEASPIMKRYKETLYNFAGEEGIVIPGWNLMEVEYETYEYLEDDGFPYKGFILYMEVKRQSAYYLYKVIIPIIFILSISWSVFWIRGDELEAKANITIVCLLALIAYNFIIDEDLPKLAYLTFLDSFILLSYFYTGIATILCVSSFLRKRVTGQEISRIDKQAQWIGPLSYFGILFSLLIYFYNFKGALSLLASIVS